MLFKFAIVILLAVLVKFCTSKFQDYQSEAKKIIDFVSKGPSKGSGYEWLANVTDTFGNRILGWVALENAIDYVVGGLGKQGFNNVHTETVQNLPHWVRGAEIATLIQPRKYPMALLGLGNTVPTPDEGLTAKAIVVRSFDELNQLGKNGKIRGKIVVYNEPWTGEYGTTVAYRSGGSQAAKWGANAVLIRSVTSFSVYSPHTGHTGYSSPKLAIPAACITVEDAEMLWRMQKRGQKLKIFLKIKSKTLTTTISSRNTVFELQGVEKPNEIVLLSGHFDSWDVGQGAMDDGGGCAVMWQALTSLKLMGLRPKRTIRVVFWIGEEEGMLGSTAYYNRHKNLTNETFFFVSESDMGVFRPTSLNASILYRGNGEHLKNMTEIATVIQRNGIPISVKPSSSDLGDVELWARSGVPGFTYLNHDTYQHYFIFHHTNADMMTIYKSEDIDYTAAVFAVFANAIASF